MAWGLPYITKTVLLAVSSNKNHNKDTKTFHD